MKSKVFSVLKIVAVAMMLVWALQPTAAQAGGNCTLNGPYYYGSGFGDCENYCTQQMGWCTELANGGCYYWLYPDFSGQMACESIPACVSDLYSCLNICAKLFQGCPGDPGPIWP